MTYSCLDWRWRWIGHLASSVDDCSRGSTAGDGAGEDAAPLQQPWEACLNGTGTFRLEVRSSAEPGAVEDAAGSGAEDRCRLAGRTAAETVAAERSVAATDPKDGYRIEKFVFDNGVDSVVPGYIAIPDQRRAGSRHPHHARSRSTKDNMFGYQPTSQDVAGMLAKQVCRAGHRQLFQRRAQGDGSGRRVGEAGKRRGSGDVALQAESLAGADAVGMMLRDEQIALDYLESGGGGSKADRSAGMSMGSTRAWWLRRSTTASRRPSGGVFHEVRGPDRDPRSQGAWIYYFVPGL